MAEKTKGTAERIHHRLENHPSGRSATRTETHPTRVVHNVYEKGFNSQRGDQPKGSEDINGDVPLSKMRR